MLDAWAAESDAHPVMMSLITCPHCRLVCKAVERDCAHCGATLRTSDGSIPKTAAAVILGLTMTACGGPKEPEPVPAYGVAEPPPTTVPEPEVPPAGTTTPTAAPSATPTAAPEPEVTAAPAYGVAMPPPEQPE